MNVAGGVNTLESRILGALSTRMPAVDANDTNELTTDDAIDEPVRDFGRYFDANTATAVSLRQGGVGVYVTDAFEPDVPFAALMRADDDGVSRVAIIAADCGTGKTVAMLKIARANMDAGRRVLVVVPRASLAESLFRLFGRETGYPGMLYLDAPRRAETSYSYYVTTVDSLHTIMDNGQYNGEFECVIVDELALVVRHALVGATLDRTNDSRIIAIGLLRETIARASVLVCCDKDVGPVELSFVGRATCAQHASLFKLESSRRMQLLCFEKKHEFMAALLSQLEQGHRLAIFVPSSQASFFYFFYFFLF